jgi:hypothetical protein
MGEHQHVRTVLAAATIAIASVVLVGCSGGQQTDRAGGAASSSTPTPTPTASATVALQDAVLTTAELPTGGWTLKPEESSGGTTSTDKGSHNTCEGDFGDVFGGAADADEAGSTWTREATSSTMSVSVIADTDAARHVSDLAAAIRSCPSTTTFTSDGQQASVALAVADLGAWGDERTCVRIQFDQGGTFAYGTMCLVADNGSLVGMSAFSPYSSDLPTDDEVQQITTAAVDKAERVLG